METIERLNELLEAERAGVETLSRLLEGPATPEMRELLEGARDDEAWSCAGLVSAIRRLGGATSKKKSDFAGKVMAEGSLRSRLRLLNRGQGWVVKRLDEVLERELDGESRAFLGEMRAVHQRNIGRCERLIAELDAPEALGGRR
jgi:nitronate monooxygenase